MPDAQEISDLTWETAMKLQVARANLRPFAKAERQAAMWDESIHLVIGIAGNGSIQLSGCRHDVMVGDMLVVPWGTPVAYAASPDHGLTIASIHLVPWTGSNLPPEPQTKRSGASTKAPVLPPLPKGIVHAINQPNVTDLALAAIATWDNSSGSIGWRACQLRGIATCLFSSLYPTNNSVRPIDALLWWLKASIGHNITRADMCRRANLGQTALGRMVREATGHSPTDWLIHLRLEEAHRLLTGTKIPIAQVATAVGFRDRSHFTHLYRRRFGHPPSSVGRS